MVMTASILITKTKLHFGTGGPVPKRSFAFVGTQRLADSPSPGVPTDIELLEKLAHRFRLLISTKKAVLSLHHFSEIGSNFSSTRLILLV